MPHSTIMRTSWRALAGAALVAGLPGALAIAAPSRHPAATAVLVADDAHVSAGDVLVLRGRHFPPNAHVTLRGGRDGRKTARIGSADTGRRGRFVAEVRIEADAAAGDYVAMACHDRCRIKATVLFGVRRP